MALRGRLIESSLSDRSAGPSRDIEDQPDSPFLCLPKGVRSLVYQYLVEPPPNPDERGELDFDQHDGEMTIIDVDEQERQWANNQGNTTTDGDQGLAGEGSANPAESSENGEADEVESDTEDDPDEQDERVAIETKRRSLLRACMEIYLETVPLYYRSVTIMVGYSDERPLIRFKREFLLDPRRRFQSGPPHRALPLELPIADASTSRWRIMDQDNDWCQVTEAMLDSSLVKYEWQVKRKIGLFRPVPNVVLKVGWRMSLKKEERVDDDDDDVDIADAEN